MAVDTALSVNRRILIVDDNPVIQGDFRTILVEAPYAAAEIDADSGPVPGMTVPSATGSGFEIDAALQGEDALRMVSEACDAGRPYAMAFVAMRLSPGWDGLTTISEIWERDPEIQIVICTGYPDPGWEEIQATLAARDRWLVLKKPFETIEVLQFAHALTSKWTLAKRAGLQMESLERMVAARTAELEQAHRVSREFLANVNHELFTPMNGICGSLDIVVECGLNGEQLFYVDQARDCAGDLLRLLTRIREFNRVDAGQLRPDAIAFSPMELIDALALEHAAFASGKGLQLHTRCAVVPAGQWVGPDKLIRKTLALLTDNAIKFTKTGAVTLVCERAAEGLRFSVTDTGPGMTPDELERIRIPFAQVDSGMARKSSGIGLGLSLAHRYVQAMAGTLSVESPLHGGVTIGFTIGASVADSPGPGPSRPRSRLPGRSAGRA